MNLLETINEPAELRKLSRAQLTPLAHELRNFLLDSVSKTGGHLAPSLGDTKTSPTWAFQEQCLTEVGTCPANSIVELGLLTAGEQLISISGA